MTDRKQEPVGAISPARAREELVMRSLARTAAGDGDAVLAEHALPLRQLGYAATLVEGYVDDPQDRLGALIRKASGAPPSGEEPDGGYVDPVQARWRAPWHMDARKLRLETPLHLKELRLQGARP